MDLKKLSTVLLDTSSCIYFLDGTPEDARHNAVATIMRAAERKKLTIVISPITVSELLVKPLREQDTESETAVRLLLDVLCDVRAITDLTASVAANLRALHELRTPDAFILATAIEHSVDAVIGNDEHWKRLTEVDYCHLDDEVG
ncbi:MAG: type II toxin-antitoxin system VapC family toxin [Acidimicrobiales bacterium]